MNPQSRVRISKQLSLMLRHRPQEFGISLDRFGFAHLDEVLEALQERNPGVSLDDVRQIVDDPNKQRFEIQEGRIRARYGHSLALDLGKDPVEPPGLLYHGTDPEAAVAIQHSGLEPAGRQYVHLSLTPEVAVQIARRRSDTPVVLRIRAGEAHQAGVKFYECGPVFLTEKVPPQFLERLSEQPAAEEAESQDPAPQQPAPEDHTSEVSYGRKKHRAVR